MTAEVRAPETEPSWTLRMSDAFLNELGVDVVDDFVEGLAATHQWVATYNTELPDALVMRGWYGARSDLDACRLALRPMMERLTAWRNEHGEPLHPGPVRV